MKTILDKACATLESAFYYLNPISPEQYQKPVIFLMNASIGQHTRHFIESLQCLLEQSIQGNEVNYDLRQRNRELETSPGYAARSIDQLILRLTRSGGNGNMKLVSGVNSDFSVQSSFERELLYNIDHVVHHLALIRVGLMAVAPHIELPEHFGVAESTMKYRESQRPRLVSAALLMAG